MIALAGARETTGPATMIESAPRTVWQAAVNSPGERCPYPAIGTFGTGELLLFEGCSVERTGRKA